MIVDTAGFELLASGTWIRWWQINDYIWDIDPRFISHTRVYYRNINYASWTSCELPKNWFYG